MIRYYLLALLSGIPRASYSFVLGYYSHIHWSTYVASRTFFVGLFTLFYFCLTHGWTAKNASNAEASISSYDGPNDHSTYIGFQPLWISMMAALLTGPIGCICRVTQVFGCHELEDYAPGCAGIVGNLIHACQVPLTAFYAFLFYGEIMTPLNMVGAALVTLSIVTIAIAKMVRPWYHGKDGSEGQEGEEMGDKRTTEEVKSVDENQEEKTTLLTN